MAVELPAISTERAIVLVICGDATSRKPPQLKRFGHQIATTGKSGLKQFVTVDAGGKSGNHFHLLIENATFLNEKPKTTCSKSSIQSQLATLDGITISAYSFGSFVVPLSELPDDGIVKATHLTFPVGQVVLEMTGGNVNVKGAPVTSLSWHVSRESQAAFVGIYSVTKEILLDDGFVTREFELVCNAFKSLILGKAAS